MKKRIFVYISHTHACPTYTAFTLHRGASQYGIRYPIIPFAFTLHPPCGHRIHLPRFAVEGQGEGSDTWDFLVSADTEVIWEGGIWGYSVKRPKHEAVSDTCVAPLIFTSEKRGGKLIPYLLPIHQMPDWLDASIVWKRYLEPPHAYVKVKHYHDYINKLYPVSITNYTS